VVALASMYFLISAQNRQDEIRITHKGRHSHMKAVFICFPRIIGPRNKLGFRVIN
jgi:hypothetical protein